MQDINLIVGQLDIPESEKKMWLDLYSTLNEEGQSELIAILLKQARVEQ